jgi:ADP-heptose:LPS heptosyltransferase
MRILIVNITRLGDQLQTSPTIAGLKERHPEAEITVVGDARHMEVCRGIPGVDRVYELDLNRIGRDLLAGGTRLVDAYRYVEGVVADLRAPGFDLAFNFSSSRMSSVFMRLLRIRDCRGWMMDSEGNRLILHPWSRLFVASVLNRRYTPYNLVDFYCRVAEVRPREQRLRYEISPAGEARARALLAEAGVPAEQRVVALQPGASNAIRQWPPESFAALARRLQDDLGAWVLLLGGPDDSPLCERIGRQAGSRVVSAAGRTDLPALAGLLARSAALVTGDTGPMHLATAVGTPVVAMYFGPAYVWETGPYGTDHVAFQTRIACSPCHHAVRCLVPVCRDDVTPEMVFWAVRDRLALDFDALARRAREWNGVDVFRTAFDTEGMSDPIPLVPRADATEAFRLAYREMWRVALDGSGDDAAAIERLRERWAARAGAAAVDLRAQRVALEALAALGQRGASLGEALSTEAGRPQASIERLEAIARQIEQLDEEITRIGHVEEAVGAIARTFAFGKENLSETPALEVLGRETVALYRALGRWAGLTLRLIDEVGCGGRPAAAERPRARGARADTVSDAV